MANRIGKICDDCPDGVVIGTLAHPLMYVVVGSYEDGVVAPSARLPRFAWDIYLHYNEKDDALDLQPLPRCELCTDCWERKLTAKGATKIMTREEFLVSERVARGIPAEGWPPPEPTREQLLGRLGLPSEATDEDIEAALRAEELGGNGEVPE